MSQVIDYQAFDDTEYGRWLLTAGRFAQVKRLSDVAYAGIKPLLFHWTLIIGEIGDTIGYSDRWCFATEALARQALVEWDGIGDPKGWHRHPMSGRRRPDGDPAKEYIDP